MRTRLSEAWFRRYHRLTGGWLNYFFYKLNAPRPTFPDDITPAELVLMQQHIAYLTGLMKQGMVVAFGPVVDPAGSYGIGILRLENSEDAMALGANDPAIRADAGFSFEVRPMPRLVLSGAIQ